MTRAPLSLMPGSSLGGRALGGCALGAWALGAVALGTACVPPPDREPREPMGRLPGLVTTAEPEWIPFAVRAGEAIPADARERRLGEPRRFDAGGEPTHLAWARDGKSLLVEVRPAGAPCEVVVSLDLGSGEARPVSGQGLRGRLGAALGEGRALVAEAPCDTPADRAAWTLVDVDPTSNQRRIVARPEGEVMGVTSDGQVAFVTARDARGRGRVERAALDGGAAQVVIDGTATGGAPSIATATATLVVVRETPAGGAQLVLASDRGGDPRPWSRGTSRDADPSLAPDGRSIVFASSRAAPSAAGRTPPSGGAPERGRARAGDPSQLFLGATALGEADGGPAAERVTFAGDDNRAPAVAPAGRHLAWISDRAAPGGPRSVIVARFDGEP